VQTIAPLVCENGGFYDGNICQCIYFFKFLIKKKLLKIYLILKRF
jgi:hypothetical protein